MEIILRREIIWNRFMIWMEKDHNGVIRNTWLVASYPAEGLYGIWSTHIGKAIYVRRIM